MLAISLAILICPQYLEPPASWIPLAMITAGGLLCMAAAFRPAGLFLVAAASCLLVYQARLADRLAPDLAGTVHQVEGTVVSVPQERDGSIRFRFESSVVDGSGIPGAILTSWYREWPNVKIGQKWRLELRLKPPWGTVNFFGPDRERWLFAEGVGAYGSVKKGTLLEEPATEAFPVQRLRARVRESISRQVGQERQRGVINALATADRSGISAADNQLLRITGTSHLLAISGLHIGLAALGGLLAGRCLVLLIPGRLPGKWLRFPVYASGAAAAISYAALANLGVSTVRALLMLLAVYLVMSLSRSVNPFRVFTVALTGVLLSNPFAPLGAGFWFSFLAVFALLFAFQPRNPTPGWWRTAVTAQAAVFLVLLPVNAAWYSGISLIAFAANLAAIPWVSFSVVPPVLAGVVLDVAGETAAGHLWNLAGLSITALFQLLEGLASVQPWLLGVRQPGLAVSSAAVLGSVLLLLPRGLGYRWLGLFLVFPLLLPAREPVPDGWLRIDALDVGQGTAVAVSTTSSTLLYDTGPGNGAGIDHISSAVSPLIAALGRDAPDRVVISHGDLDHTGGLQSVRRRYPRADVLGSMREPGNGHTRCQAGIKWQREGFGFRVLHPSASLPYLKNNSSCVLAVGDSRAGLLLPGDIEDFVESRLLLEGVGAYPVMLAPHHGSLSSSGAAFIERVSPSVVVASAGLGNRFGFPRAEVRARYRAIGADFWATGECGGLKLIVNRAGEISASSARRERRRIWRWPAAANCP